MGSVIIIIYYVRFAIHLMEVINEDSDHVAEVNSLVSSYQVVVYYIQDYGLCGLSFIPIYYVKNLCIYDHQQVVRYANYLCYVHAFYVNLLNFGDYVVGKIVLLKIVLKGMLISGVKFIFV